MRFAFVVAGLLAATTAFADPVDPYGPPAPAPTPTPTNANDQAAPADPVLAEQIAQSLVARAQELLEAKLLLEAKQLAIEAIVRSPKGASADHAHQIVKAVDQELGIPEDKPAGPGDQPPPPPPLPPVKPLEDQPQHTAHVASYVHGGLLGGAIGAMIGTTFSSDTGKQVGGAIPLGLVGAAGAAYGVSKLVDRFGWSEAQVRTTGAGSVWGGVVGGLVADIATGTHGTTGRQVLIGGSIGAVAGAIGGGVYASQNKLTRGDVALIDTLAGIGAFGGVTLGMIMQPVESEAYSLNSVVGTIGGVIVGLVAAPQTNTTPRRMARVAGLAAIGAALPFLLYAAVYTPTSTTRRPAS